MQKPERIAILLMLFGQMPGLKGFIHEETPTIRVNDASIANRG